MPEPVKVELVVRVSPEALIALHRMARYFGMQRAEHYLEACAESVRIPAVSAVISEAMDRGEAALEGADA